MQETENAVETSQLIEVHRRRVGLRHTMTAVEEAASSALAGRATEWRQKSLTQIDDLRAAWESHVSGTEGPGGLWDRFGLTHRVWTGISADCAASMWS